MRAAAGVMDSHHIWMHHETLLLHKFLEVLPLPVCQVDRRLSPPSRASMGTCHRHHVRV